jgi:hypothetical protein
MNTQPIIVTITSSTSAIFKFKDFGNLNYFMNVSMGPLTQKQNDLTSYAESNYENCLVQMFLIYPGYELNLLYGFVSSSQSNVIGELPPLKHPNEIHKLTYSDLLKFVN